MGTMSNGYYYDQVRNGEGWTVSAGRLTFFRCTKTSTRDLKRQLKADGFTESEITIEKGE